MRKLILLLAIIIIGCQGEKKLTENTEDCNCAVVIDKTVSEYNPIFETNLWTTYEFKQNCSGREFVKDYFHNDDPNYNLNQEICDIK